MTRLQTYNGKLLYLDGKLITSTECCCDDDCPECPSLPDMPRFCQLKITTPLGDYHLAFPGPLIPGWRRLTAAEDGIPAGECWYELSLFFDAPECIGTCRDLSPSVPLSAPIVCTAPSNCCCVPFNEDDGCPEEELAPAVETWRLEGVIRYAMRELISDGNGTLVYRINCNTGQKYRKLSWEYIHSQSLTGRFIGTKQHTIVASGAPCSGNICRDVTRSYNQSTGHECDECPQFNWISDEDVHSGHNWESDLWNKIGVSDVGLQYFGNVGVKYLEEDWVEVDDFFTDESLTPRFGCGPCFPYPLTSLARCEQVDKEPGIVGIGGDCLLFDFEPPSEFSYWMCDENYPGGASEPFKADAPYPPAGVTIRHEPSACPEIEGDEYQWPYGDLYIPHPVSWDTSASCMPTQPNKAIPCE